MKNLNNRSGRVSILNTDLVSFEEGQWKVYKRLNGDQTHQERHIPSFADDVSLQSITLYSYN
jgi:hypothetical protein